MDVTEDCVMQRPLLFLRFHETGLGSIRLASLALILFILACVLFHQNGDNSRYKIEWKSRTRNAEIFYETFRGMYPLVERVRSLRFQSRRGPLYTVGILSYYLILYQSYIISKHRAIVIIVVFKYSCEEYGPYHVINGPSVLWVHLKTLFHQV